MRVRLCVPDAAWRPVCASHRTLQSRSAAVYDENKRRRAALGAAGYAAEGAHKLAMCGELANRPKRRCAPDSLQPSLHAGVVVWCAARRVTAARGRMLRLAAAAAARAVSATPAGCVAGLRGALTGQSGSVTKGALSVTGGATATSARALVSQACKAQGTRAALERRLARAGALTASLRLPRGTGACGRVCGPFGRLPCALESAAAVAPVAASSWSAAVATASGRLCEAQTCEEDEQAQEAQADQAGEEQEPRRLICGLPTGDWLRKPAWGLSALLFRDDDVGSGLTTLCNDCKLCSASCLLSMLGELFCSLQRAHLVFKCSGPQ